MLTSGLRTYARKCQDEQPCPNDSSRSAGHRVRRVGRLRWQLAICDDDSGDGDADTVVNAIARGDADGKGVVPDVSAPTRRDLFTEANDPALARAIALLQ